MAFGNVYDDAERAAAYAQLGFPGTYYLAFRDLPEILKRHVVGATALDFGCGTGRSTRFLARQGFSAVGIDIAQPMVDLAKKMDPAGNYRTIADGDFSTLRPASFDLVLSAFAFDNIPGRAERIALLHGLGKLLKTTGRLVILGSAPEIYWHEWASFTTQAFPANRKARSGEGVRIVMKDVPDARPVDDLIWFHEDYLDAFEQAGLRLVAQHKPLGTPADSIPWLAETSVAPWVIYVVAPA